MTPEEKQAFKDELIKEIKDYLVISVEPADQFDTVETEEFVIVLYWDGDGTPLCSTPLPIPRITYKD
jgi:hypothetical protein